MERIPFSKEGYDKLRGELDRLKNVEMPRIAEEIATARSFGDLSENAEYDAAREEQGRLQARIVDLEDRLARAIIVDKKDIPTDRVVFGTTVKIYDLTYEEEEVYTFVGPGDEDYENNKILLSSPIGQGLLGKRVGEEVEIPVPRGTLKLRILEIGVNPD